MTVILEGPDGGGKTTLASGLCQRYTTGRVHNGPPAATATATGLAREYLRDAARTDVIVDRWALGETIYGPLFRGESLVTPRAWGLLCDVLDLLYVPLIVCLPPQAVALDNWRRRRDAGGERFDNAIKIASVYDEYRAFTTLRTGYRLPRWMWVYDYTNPTDTVEMMNFLDVLKEKQR